MDFINCYTDLWDRQEYILWSKVSTTGDVKHGALGVGLKMSPTPQLLTRWVVCNTSTTQRTKKTIEKCLLTYFAVPKFVLYEEIELTKMICLYVAPG